MKTINEITDVEVTFNKNIDDQIKVLERMKEEMAKRAEKAKMLIPKLSEIFKTLHLEIDGFGFGRPSSNFKNLRGDVSFSLKSDGNFKFIKFSGYDSRGAAKNRASLERKARNLEEKIEKMLENENLNISCQVNEYSLESRENNSKIVLIDIFYDL